MALTPGSELKIVHRYTCLGQKCENIQYVSMQGAAVALSTIPQILEAYWNDIKAAWHAILPTSLALGSFDELLGYEVGGTLAYGGYTIPFLERVGTRAGLTLLTMLPPFNCSGSQQSVSTRVTRPGQKRIPFLADSDVEGNALAASSLSLFAAAHDTFGNVHALGAPAAGVVLQPRVGGTLVDDVPTVFQDVADVILNLNVTSQVSRKIGRGT